MRSCFFVYHRYRRVSGRKEPDMAFTPINTQEEFDAAISERLKREAEKDKEDTSPKDLEKIKADYDRQITDLNATVDSVNKQLKEKDDSIAERDAKISGYETNSVKMRIAREAGLPYESVDYIRGEDEESIKKSAQALKELIGNKNAAPLKDQEPPDVDDTAAAYLAMSRELRGEE